MWGASPPHPLVYKPTSRGPAAPGPLLNTSQKPSYVILRNGLYILRYYCIAIFLPYTDETLTSIENFYSENSNLIQFNEQSSTVYNYLLIEYKYKLY